jgi:outer membrane protein
MILRLFNILLLLTIYTLARNEYKDKSWGVGVVGQVDTIAYDYISIEDNTVNNFIPLFYYENKYIYMRGLTAGAKLFSDNNFQFSLLSRIRLLSIPKELQNKIQGDSLDYGLRSRYFLKDNQYIDLELMNNTNGGTLMNFKYSSDLIYSNIYISPYTNFIFKDGTFNKSYYGRDIEQIDGDIDINAGVDIKYHIYSNFYLLAGVGATYLGQNVRDSNIVSDDFTYKFNAGIAILNDKNREFYNIGSMKEYIRVAQGFATVSSLADVLVGESKKDEYNNQFTSIFYGLPIYQNLFNLPLEVYLSSGIVQHHSSEVQDNILEGDFALKIYYTLPLDYINMRLGLGEGLSYIEDITYIENLDGEEKGYEMSNLNFFLDLSVDINLDFIDKELDNLWLGLGVHHRSSVFETSSLFGRIKGGSNYNSLYLQWDF